MTAASKRQSSDAAPGEVYRDRQGGQTFTLERRDEFDAGWYGVRSDYGPWHVGQYAFERFYEPTCDRLLVGQGSDTYDPVCVLPESHDGTCKPEEASNGA